MQNDDTGTVSLTGLAIAVLRHRRRIARATFGGALAAGLLVIALGREYASEGRFVADAGAGSAGMLSGIAAQFGLSAALPGAGHSPDFYASLAKSRTVLGAVADSTFRFTEVTGFLFWKDTVERVGSVAQLYRIDRPRNPARERDEAIELLGELVSAGASLETGIVSVRVQTDWPGLSYAISRQVLSLIENYNLQTLQLRASEERRFVEDRLQSQRLELAVEEDSLKQFLEKNRLFTASPQLMLEHDRLQRKVMLRQQVVVGLAQAYEQSRIEEVRNTPVLTIVQAPEQPAKGVRRYLIFKVAAAALLVFSLFAGAAIIEEDGRGRSLRREEELDELRSLISSILGELRSTFRRRREA